jgi:hypothetical protein
VGKGPSVLRGESERDGDGSNVRSGRDDPIVPKVNSEFLHDRLPNNRMDLLPAAHYAWEEVPDLYGDVLINWLSRKYREPLGA